MTAEERPRCPRCSPGYRYGDEGCRHVEPVAAAEAVEDPVVAAIARAIHVPTDDELDALTMLVNHARIGCCQVHDACRAVMHKKQRDAARRWFIDRRARAALDALASRNAAEATA